MTANSCNYSSGALTPSPDLRRYCKHDTQPYMQAKLKLTFFFLKREKAIYIYMVVLNLFLVQFRVTP